MKKFVLVFVLSFFVAHVCVAQAPNSEVYLLNVSKKNGGFVFSNGRNISNSPGYDNQPSFTLDNRSILFTSNRRQNNFDIYEYSISDRGISPVITSGDNEYSAREIDQNTVAFVREGRDQLMTVVKYDRASKTESLAFKVKDPIAYYAFNKKGDALVWVRYAFWMRWVNTEKSINRFVANYAQPSVPHLIPGSDSFSFMVRRPDDSLWIMEFNPENQALRPIVQAKDGKKDYCWMADGSLLTASGSVLYRFDEKVDKAWVKIADLESFGIKNITRMAASGDGRRIAVVENK